ncbi:MAG: ABC transporter permease, partial [Acidimicrobiales bacterium]|nr:ABC transporter permease [Acidimicrobiales bacterium]
MTASSGASGASRATPATGGASAARAIATIAANELRRTARDRTAMIFIVVLPVMIIVLIGTTFGDMEGFDVGVIDRDGTTASHDLVATLDSRDGLSLERFDSIDALRREVRTGAVAAGIVVPGGYGDALDRGGDATVELIADPTSSTAAAVQASVRAAVGDAAVQMAAVRGATDAGGLDPATAERQAAALAEDLPRAGVRSQPVDEGDTPELGSFDYTAPSNLVLFTFVNTVVVGSIIALERKQGITRRLLATPHGTGTILAGIGTAKLLFALLQSTLIVVIAAVFFDVGWGDPLGAVLLVVTFALVATAVGLLVGAVVSDPEQAQAAAVPIAIGLAMLGGCMWPLEIVPPVMRTIGHVAPHAWAMDGWIALVFEGEPAGAIATELAVLAAYAAVLG